MLRNFNNVNHKKKSLEKCKIYLIEFVPHGVLHNYGSLQD